jgi:hypothetical protein
VKSRPLIVTALFLYFGLQLAAQVERVLPRRGSSSLEGTSFVVGFMQNELLEVGVDPRLQIFISSQNDATVTIESMFEGVKVVKVPAYSVHVENVHVYNMNSASEYAMQKSIFVTSDVPIVVYALNTLLRSTDSYSAIPIRHLGTQYYSINRPSDRYPASANPTSAKLRSGEFMIMAVEDGTNVEVIPATATFLGRPANVPFKFVLNRGECYLVQAATTAIGRDDLTGSSIISSKPVAVISGHMRTSVPTSQDLSKDHLVEQLPPVTKWGKTFATAPFLSTERADVYRFMASQPNQKITMTTRTRSRTWTMPSVGSYIDTSIAEAASWTSSEPFFMVQHMASRTTNRGVCDPAMVITPPIEQFVNEALFRFPTLEPVRTTPPQTLRYYLNVIATPEALPSLMIGSRRAASMAPLLNVQVVPGTNLRWAQISMQEGAYLMRCDSGSFSAVMYGTSEADSYANLVGLAFDPVRRRDSSPPIYELTQDCGTVKGRIIDVSRDSARLSDVEVITGSTFNYTWTVSKPTDAAGSVRFDAAVRDRSKDAQIVIHAYDDRGNGREWLYRYDAPDIDVQRDVVIQTERGVERCTTVVIRNRDSTPVSIRGIDLQGNQRIVVTKPTGGFVIRPRDSALVTICATQWADTAAMVASITLRMNCGETKTFYVRSRRGLSLKGDTLDFGEVRIGDTACGRIAIINDGDRPTDAQKLITSTVDTNFVVDTASLGLPRSIPAGDTLWVSACFIARQRGSAERIDSVVGSVSTGAVLVYRARGVIPEVAPLIIDWKERFVGSMNDTIVRLRNSGDGWCVVRADLSSSPSALTLNSDGLVKGARLNAGDSLEIRASFSPTTRDTMRFLLPAEVDWKAHGPLSIEFRGIGVMPDISVKDIDFDSVVIGTSRDSLAGLVVTGFDGGNTNLTVSRVTIAGPDSAAFTIPTALKDLAPGIRPEKTVLRDIVSFKPARLGLHECMIEIESNAAPEGKRALSRFRLLGIGVPVPVARPVPRVSSALRARSCVSEPILVEIANPGTARARLDSVVVFMYSAGTDERRTNVIVDPGPLFIQPGQVWTARLSAEYDTLAQQTIVLRIVDSAGTRYEDSIVVEVDQPKTSVNVDIPGAPLVVAGPATVAMTARLLDFQTVPQLPMMRLVIDRSRFSLGNPDSSFVTIERNDTLRAVRADIVQEKGAIRVRLREPVSGPWIISCFLRGTMIWADPDLSQCIGLLEGTPCFRQNLSSPVDYHVDPCGSRLRMVDIGVRPGIYVTPLGQPFDDIVSIRITTPQATSARVWAESLSGQQFLLAEHLSLQKGSQHCNFSCSGLGSGLYRLVISHGNGVEVTNIIIVN